MSRAALVLIALGLAPGAVSAGPLAFEGPEAIVIGRDDRVTLTLAAGGRVPRLVASVGTVELAELAEVAQVGAEGRLAAVYLVPDRGAPAVAIVAALDPDTGELVDWIAIPMIAQAHVAARVDRAAEVVLEVGGAIHGPFQLRAREESLVPVRVPPGVTQAEMVAVDGAGRTTRRILPLGVPDLERVLAICPRGAEHLTLVVADASGRPDSRATLALRTSTGQLGDATAAGPGVYRAALTPPAQTDRLEVTLGATIGGAVPSTCATALSGEAPRALTVTPARATGIRAGETIAVELVLGFEGRRPPASPLVTLTADRGTVRGVRALGSERVVATWTAPGRGGGVAILTARVGAIVERTEVALVPLPIAIVGPQRRYALEFQAGYVTNLARIAAPVIGVGLTARVLSPRLHAGVAIRYYTSTDTAMATGGEEVAVAVHAVPVLAQLTFDLVRSRLYVGATAGAVLGQTMVSSASSGDTVDRLLRPALGVLGGGAAGVGPGRAVLELGYLHATARGAAYGPVGGLAVTGGYRLAF